MLGIEVGFQSSKSEVDQVMQGNVETLLKLSAELVGLLGYPSRKGKGWFASHDGTS
jgi:hypothetical protein